MTEEISSTATGVAGPEDEEIRDLQITHIHDIQRTHHVDLDVEVRDDDLDAWLDAIMERLAVDGRVIRFEQIALVRFYGSRAALDQLHELVRGGMTEDEANAALDEFDDDK